MTRHNPLLNAKAAKKENEVNRNELTAALTKLGDPTAGDTGATAASEAFKAADADRQVARELAAESGRWAHRGLAFADKDHAVALNMLVEAEHAWVAAWTEANAAGVPCLPPCTDDR